MSILLGTLAGDMVVIGASSVGIGALLAMSTWAFSGLKWCAGVYLMYLGIKMLRQPAPLARGATMLPANSRHIVRDLFLVTALSPKGLVFFMAFFPLFITADAPYLPQVGILSLTFLLISVLNVVFYASLAGVIGANIRSAKFQRLLQYSGAGLLITAGLRWCCKSG